MYKYWSHCNNNKANESQETMQIKASKVVIRKIFRQNSWKMKLTKKKRKIAMIPFRFECRCWALWRRRSTEAEAGHGVREKGEREREREFRIFGKGKAEDNTERRAVRSATQRVRKTFIYWDTKTKFYIISAKILLFIYFIFNDIHPKKKKKHWPRFFFFFNIYKYGKC